MTTRHEQALFHNCGSTCSEEVVRVRILVKPEHQNQSRKVLALQNDRTNWPMIGPLDGLMSNIWTRFLEFGILVRSKMMSDRYAAAFSTSSNSLTRKSASACENTSGGLILITL